jgi:hypothetical protein
LFSIEHTREKHIKTIESRSKQQEADHDKLNSSGIRARSSMKRALHVDVHGAHSAVPGLILSIAALPVGHPTEPGPGPSRPGPLYCPGVAMLSRGP